MSISLPHFQRAFFLRMLAISIYSGPCIITGQAIKLEFLSSIQFVGNRRTLGIVHTTILSPSEYLPQSLHGGNSCTLKGPILRIILPLEILKIA